MGAHTDISDAVRKSSEEAERWREADAPDDLDHQVRVILDDDPTLSWDAAVRRIVGSE